MTIRPVRTERDHETAVARIEVLLGAEPGTPEFDELDVLAELVDAYERKHHPIAPPTPVEAIKFRMEQGDLTRAELTKLLGGRSKTTEILKKQRALSKLMIVKLHTSFAIPFESLLGDVIKASSRPRRKGRAPSSPGAAAAGTKAARAAGSRR